MFVQAPFFFKPKSPCHFFWYLLKGLLKSHSFVVYSFVVYSFVVYSELRIQFCFKTKSYCELDGSYTVDFLLANIAKYINSYLSYCNRM